LIHRNGIYLHQIKHVHYRHYRLELILHKISMLYHEPLELLLHRCLMMGLFMATAQATSRPRQQQTMPQQLPLLHH
jgi:hypothetical protein